LDVARQTYPQGCRGDIISQVPPFGWVMETAVSLEDGSLEEGPPEEGSVTRHLGKLKSGDHAAARLLWQRYFHLMVRLARQKLTNSACRAGDGEDVALAAFARFCQRAEEGRLPKVRDRDDVWRVLVTVTARMAIDQVRRESRRKRGGPAAGLPEGASASAFSPEQIPSSEPAPDFMVQVAEECERLLSLLGDDELKSIAVWKTEGYTNEQIAAELGCVLRTVERKLRAIRQRWASEPGSGQR
jgi:RNA polymerase sigma factor (sigma-70 family)